MNNDKNNSSTNDNQSSGLNSKINSVYQVTPKQKYPKWCCQSCGEPIGYIGRFAELIFGTQHNCN